MKNREFGDLGEKPEIDFKKAKISEKITKKLRFAPAEL